GPGGLKVVAVARPYRDVHPAFAARLHELRGPRADLRIGVASLHHRDACRVGQGPTRDARELRVQPEDLGGRVVDGHHHGDAVDDGLEDFSFAAQLLLSLALGGDVGVGPEPADDPPGLVTDRNRSGEEPTVMAIPAAKGEHVLPDLAVLETAGQFRRDPLDMLGMVERLPALVLYSHPR